MRSEEAASGIKRLQEHFGRKYTGDDLNPIWRELLELPEPALSRAVGELMIINGHYNSFPTATRVLECAKKWTAKLDLEECQARNEGREVSTLLNAWLSGRISEVEYIRGMYALADKYHNPVYAQIAQDREAKSYEKAV